jgi:hypothetical protein
MEAPASDRLTHAHPPTKETRVETSLLTIVIALYTLLFTLSCLLTIVAIYRRSSLKISTALFAIAGLVAVAIYLAPGSTAVWSGGIAIIGPLACATIAVLCVRLESVRQIDPEPESRA